MNIDNHYEEERKKTMKHPIDKKELEEFIELLRAIPAEEREKLLSIMRACACGREESEA